MDAYFQNGILGGKVMLKVTGVLNTQKKNNSTQQ